MYRKWYRIFIHEMDVIVLLLSLVLVFGIWNWGVKNDRSSLEVLTDSARHYSSEIESRGEHIFDYLNALRAFFENSENVTEVEFVNFVQLLMDDDYPEILRFGVFDYIPNEKLAKSESDIVQNKNYASQLVTRYVVDGKGKLQNSSRVNLRNIPERAQLIEQIDAGREKAMAYAGKVLYAAEYSGPGINYAVPIVKNGETVGMISMVVSIEYLSANLADTLPEGANWILSWGEINLGEYKANSIRNVEKVVQEIDLFDDSEWVLKVEAEKKINDYWNWMLGVGVVVSFVIYGMVYAMSLSGVKAQEMAEKLNLDMKKYKQAIDSSHNHIIITDVDGKIIYANDSAQRLTGYNLEEMRGNTPRLWGRQMPPEFYAKFWDTIKNKRRVFEGEVINRNKSGKKYQAYATVSPIIDDATNELIGFVGVEYDITARKEMENDLKRMNELMVGRELRMAELKQQLAKEKSPNEL